MLIFKANELIPVIHEAREKKCKILLVKDHGVYVLSENRDANPDSSCKNIAYAKGFNPAADKFDDWWDKANNELGGDDFAEPLDPFDEVFNVIVEHQYDMIVEATKEFLRLGYLAKQKQSG
ncbi:DUF3085 domain-containing protein [Saezia sanguinis]|uniref:DUF3085 domain-containing protein n=1 Tax=Saezia sanguinis TaxID=1965230 RepID=UPI00306F2886